MKPIIFKQSDISKIYELELHNYDNWFIIVDGNNYLTQNCKTKISYKVNITKTEEPLQKIKQDYELDQKINDACDEFLNKLIDFNIFEVVDDYRKFIVDKGCEYNIDDVEPVNKYEALEWYLKQSRIKPMIFIEITNHRKAKLKHITIFVLKSIKYPIYICVMLKTNFIYVIEF